jgi:peptidoglycan/LPS O-acetylase OafA/YrhL
MLSAHEKIDICRGVFAFLVVIAHSLQVAWEIHPAAPASLSWLGRTALTHVAGNGIYWVMGFFVISGYCIALSVTRSIDGDQFPMMNYLIARLTRILPLYYLSLLFTVFVEWLIAPSRPTCWANGLSGQVLLDQLFLIQNLTQTFGSFAPSWSITNEVFYYLFYGLIVWVALKRGLRPTTLGMIACAVVALVMDGLHFGWTRSPIVLRSGLLFGLGTIWFSGAMVADYSEELVNSRWARRISAFWPAILACALGMLPSQQVHTQFIYVVLGIAFSLMLVRFLVIDNETQATIVHPVRSRLITLLGLASYPTYLFHGPVIMLIGSYVLRFNLFYDWRVTWLILSLAGIAVGMALGYLAERPIMSWRAGLLRGLRVPARVPGRRELKTPVLGIQR